MNIHIFEFCAASVYGSGTYLEYVVFIGLIIWETFLGRYIISPSDYNSPTWIQVVIVEHVFSKEHLNINM